GAEIHRDAMLHDAVLRENRVELAERIPVVAEVVLGDDLEPVDDGLAFEDVLDMRLAQSDTDAVVLESVEGVGRHVRGPRMWGVAGRPPPAAARECRRQR